MENKTDQKQYSPEELEAMMKTVNEIPPITGNMIKDYTGLLMKELVALGNVWALYLNDDSPENAIISNHITTMQLQYDRLLSGIEAIGKPEHFDKLTNPQEG